MKSERTCKDNPECTVKVKAAANKYMHLPREIEFPPQLVAPMPLSFFDTYSAPLIQGAKTETRRAWKNQGYIDSHHNTLATQKFVRVWAGGKGNLIGYAIYHSITRQKVGDMTLADVKAEGYGGMSLEDFKKDHLFAPKETDVLWVVRFTFLHLC
jgi:hypothetical protein